VIAGPLQRISKENAEKKISLNLKDEQIQDDSFTMKFKQALIFFLQNHSQMMFIQ
jgi:hypothetical protein